MFTKSEEEEHRQFARRLANFADWTVRGLIAASFGFIWQMYIAQQEFIQASVETNMRVTQLEKDLARIEGNMVTIETLKRVEIYMELILAKSGIQQKIDLTSRTRKGDKEE